MSSYKFSCPSCHVALQSDKPFPAKTTLQCPKCSQPFQPSLSTLPLVESATPETILAGANPWRQRGLLLAGAVVLVFGAGLAAAVVLSRGLKDRSSSSADDGRLAQLEKEKEQLKKEKEALQIKQLLSDAQRAMDDKRFDDARKDYEQVLDMDSSNARATEGLRSVRLAKKEAAESDDKDKQFAASMKAGNDAMDRKDYLAAVVAYETACKIKVDDLAIKALLEARTLAAADDADKKKLVDYKLQMETGDQQMRAQNYKDALAAYNKALVLVPGDPIAQKKAAQVQKRLEDAAKDRDQKQDYDALVAQARRDLTARHFNSSIQALNKAIGLLPQEADAPQLLKDAQQKQKTARMDFDNVMQQGNLALAGGMIDLAILYFTQAGDAMPDNAEAAAAAKKKALLLVTALEGYKLAMQQGDLAMTTKMYDVAVIQYTQALTLVPGDVLATAGLEKARVKDRERRAEFDRLMTAGNQALATMAFADALKAFEAALVIAPDNLLARDGRHKAREGLRDQIFTQAMKAGDAAMTIKNYKEAVRQYEMALQEKPNDINAKLRLSTAKGSLGK